MKLLSVAVALALGALPALALADNGRYIVKFTEGHGQAGAAALHAAGANVVLELAPQNAVAARIPDHALPGLQHNPNIEYIEEDAIREPMALWSDRTRTSPNANETVPYGIQMVQADLVTSTNEGAKKICIIDSGYSDQHVDLKDGVTHATTSGAGTWNKDSCGHGSHVAGTISATAGNNTGVVGVIPGVQLYIVKVFGDDNLVDGGNCAWTYSSNLVSALNLCTAAGANITSMSLGGSVKSRTEDNAFASAYKNGVLNVAAAGNAGNKTTSYPAGYASVISVAAVDANETVASFSQQNRDVELAAPGVGVLSTVPWTDTDTLSYSGGGASGGHVEFSGRTAGLSAPMVDGAQCTAAGAWSGKVVLCQRGTNSFLEKVNNVTAGGGLAAVIYNNVTSDATCGDFLGTLGDGNSSPTPAISVSCDEGAAAVAKAGNAGTVVSLFNANSSGYEAWDGTSMATPHVSGVAALVWSCFPTLKNTDIRTALTNTARNLGAAGRDVAYGYGVVQAAAAVTSLGTSSFCSVSSSSKY